ncbi:MAG: hypothetical protein Q8K60_00710 [Parachlamydiaceae bacterium]|nr:hypothetical protein [Parachlamydiaceae bacterium]
MFDIKIPKLSPFSLIDHNVTKFSIIFHVFKIFFNNYLPEYEIKVKGGTQIFDKINTADSEKILYQKILLLTKVLHQKNLKKEFQKNGIDLYFNKINQYPFIEKQILFLNFKWIEEMLSISNIEGNIISEIEKRLKLYSLNYICFLDYFYTNDELIKVLKTISNFSYDGIILELYFDINMTYTFFKKISKHNLININWRINVQDFINKFSFIQDNFLLDYKGKNNFLVEGKCDPTIINHIINGKKNLNIFFQDSDLESIKDKNLILMDLYYKNDK